MLYKLDDDKIWFPPPEHAEPDGLLAVGGDLSPERLILAYSLGIFPWFSDETPILWYSPHERFVIFPDRLQISKSMRKVMRSGWFEITWDKAFAKVVAGCAQIGRKDQQGTWITNEMKRAYQNLHEIGIAHSVEVWLNGSLAGGLYGVVVGNVFCGESMFSEVSNASKAALIWLCKTKHYKMIDCQLYTAHLESLGAEFITRDRYLSILRQT